MGRFWPGEEKLLVFELFSQKPSNTLYLPGKLEITMVNQKEGPPRIVGTGARLRRKYGFLRRLKRLLQSVCFNSVWVMKINTCCPDNEKQSIIDWTIATERLRVKAAIISILDAEGASSLRRFIQQCMGAIRRRIRKVKTVAIMVEEYLLTSCFGDNVEQAKRELSRRIVADCQANGHNIISFIIVAFQSVPETQLPHTVDLIYSRF